MFNSISWEYFFTALAILAGGYYAIAILLLFGDEIKSIFSPKKTNAIDARQIVNQTKPNRTKDLMGPARQLAQVSVPHENSVNAEAVLVGSDDDQDVDAVEVITEEVIATRILDELRSEITSLIEQFNPTTLEEVELAVKPVFERYASQVPEPSRSYVNQFLITSLDEAIKVPLTEEYARSLWPEAEG